MLDQKSETPHRIQPINFKRPFMDTRLYEGVSQEHQKLKNLLKVQMYVQCDTHTVKYILSCHSYGH